MHHVSLGKLTLLLYDDLCANAYSEAETEDLGAIF